MRVLFATVSGHGHVTPLLPLADAFARRGDEVTFATGADMHRLVTSAGHRLTPAGLTQSEQRPAMARIRPPDLSPSETIAFAFGTLFPTVHAPRMLPDLLRAVDDLRPDLLVCDSAELATPLVGTLRSVPWAQHSYGIVRPSYAWTSAAEAMAPLWAAHGLAMPERAGMFDGCYLDVCPPTLQSPEIGSVADRHPLRPAHTPAAVPVRAPSGEHVLVTFGTVFHPGIGSLVARLAGLPLALTVTAGPGADLAAFAGLPANVRVVEYLPLGDVLPDCSAVVTHGGSGTVLAALSHGVPLVVVPQGADNLYNGERVAAVGAGVCVTSGEQVPDALVTVLGSLACGDAARAIADEIQRLPPADAVAAALARR